MSEEKKPNVLQGKMFWEPGNLSEADPKKLEKHPKNTEIYGDTDSVEGLDEGFIESVNENGVIEPLIVNQDMKIISGHRRRLAALETGHETVPVIQYGFENELSEREALIELNRQRDKTPGQIVNEFEEMLEIKRKRAEKDRLSNLKQNDRAGNTSGSGEKGDARDRAAETINAGVSGKTLEKGLQVKEKAQKDDTPNPVKKVAKEEWDKLENGKASFHGAAKKVEKAEAEHEVKNQEKKEQKHKPILWHMTAKEFMKDLDNADLVLTDPPYSTELDDVSGFAYDWIPAMIDLISNKGCAFIFIGAYFQELNAYTYVLDNEGVSERAQMLVWTYKNTIGATPNYKYKQNWQACIFIQSEPPTELNSPKTSEQWAVQQVNAPDGRHGDRYHKWQKPDNLIRRLIRHTTNKGDLVVDPFAGTGTTLIQAAQLGRRSQGADIDEEMIKIAEERGCNS